MGHHEGLYERAEPERLAPLLHMDGGFSLWAGATGFLADHQGSAPVLLVALYGSFRLRLSGQWMTCPAAVIPPGIGHELDFNGEPFVALYVESDHGGLDALRPLIRGGREAGGVLTGIATDTALLRSLYEDQRSESWVGTTLAEMLALSRRSVGTPLVDPRIRSVLAALRASPEKLTSVEQVASGVGMSSSRLQHVFTREVGVPFRRYRAWSRLRVAWRQIIEGAAITDAAHSAGFFDSAHLAHEYQRTFGTFASARRRRLARTLGCLPTGSQDPQK